MHLIPEFKPGIWNAWIFMSVFILQMLVIMIAGSHVRKRSHVPGELERSGLERYISIITNLVWLIAMGYSIFLPFKPGTVWFFSGLIVFIIGLAILTIASYNFIYAPLEQPITKGVYRFSRHPMYLATFLICLGSGIASASWILILLCIIMEICLYKEARVEERYCLEKYGNFYRDYQNSVPMWIGFSVIKGA